jgi:hypothetical protein
MGYPLQDKTLDNALTLGTVTVGAAATGTSQFIVDLGAFDPVEFEVVLDVASVATGAGQVAYMNIEGSTQSDFSGTQVTFATVAVGSGADLNTAIGVGNTSRGIGIYRVKIDNQATLGGAAFKLRWVRIRHKTVGAGGGLTYTAYLVKR